MIHRRLARAWFHAAVVSIVACGGGDGTGVDLTRPATVRVTPDSLSIGVADTSRLRAVVLNVNGDTLQQAAVAFTSVDTAVATIDDSGLVRGLAGGVSDLFVTSGEVTATARVRVLVNGTLAASPDVTLITQHDTLQVIVVVKDSNGIVLSGEPILYRSLDTTMVRVSATGRVVFGGSAGSTRIDVESSGRRDAVFVTALVERVPLSAALLEVREDGNAFLLGDNSLLRFQLPSTTPAEEWLVPYSGVIGDAAVNADRSKAWISDPHFGYLVAMDVPSGALDTVARSTSFPNPFGPLEPVLAPGDSVLYYFADSHIHGLRLATNAQIDSVEIVGLRLAIRDSLLYALWPVRGDLQEYNIHRRTRGRLIRFGSEIFDFALSHDGEWLYAVGEGSQGSRLFVWNRVTGDTVPSIELPAPPAFNSAARLAEQPTTGHVWVSAGDGARVYVVDVDTRAVLRTLQPGGTPRGIGFAANGMGILANASGWLDFVR